MSNGGTYLLTVECLVVEGAGVIVVQREGAGCLVVQRGGIGCLAIEQGGARCLSVEQGRNGEGGGCYASS